MPRKFPTAFTILFVLIVVVAALTWIIPAGQYERALNPALGKEAPVPGTYTVVESNPQGLKDILMAPIAGLYNPATGMANAILIWSSRGFGSHRPRAARASSRLSAVSATALTVEWPMAVSGNPVRLAAFFF